MEAKVIIGVAGLRYGKAKVTRHVGVVNVDL
jgi:hypothetical protein